MGILSQSDPFHVGTYVRSAYRLAGQQYLFLITGRDDGTVWLENASTGHEMPVPVRELHDPCSWVPVQVEPE